MPRCCACLQEKDREEFSSSQLKAKGKRRCVDCVAGAKDIPQAAEWSPPDVFLEPPAAAAAPFVPKLPFARHPSCLMKNVEQRSAFGHVHDWVSLPGAVVLDSSRSFTGFLETLAGESLDPAAQRAGLAVAWKRKAATPQTALEVDRKRHTAESTQAREYLAGKITGQYLVLFALAASVWSKSKPGALLAETQDLLNFVDPSPQAQEHCQIILSWVADDDKELFDPACFGKGDDAPEGTVPIAFVDDTGFGTASSMPLFPEALDHGGTSLPQVVEALQRGRALAWDTVKNQFHFSTDTP